MYRETRKSDGSPSDVIERISDGALIPADSLNTDYQRYLEWVAAGNSPEPFN